MAPPYIEAISGDHISSRDPTIVGDPIAPNDGERSSNKGARADDVASTITGDSLIVLNKKFHYPNDVVKMVPKKSNRASLPPPGHLTICKTSLPARLRFQPPAELMEIFV
ncbi:hypothetical protein MA16_Dca006473 [Dendrobium catenatum]|uniref:Uncharacterized protein n=1 Tax=Dendrobium catenatum TaxID=906689 RepID=A0A2I0X7V4_9ASPA|nr:hypothetical protein MA16_Dca006473 [Dendrobium catenatum]